MNRTNILVFAVLGAGLFLAVPFVNAWIAPALGVDESAALPFVFAGAGLIYSVLHFAIHRTRR